MPIPTKHVRTVTVIDPDSGGRVDVEIRKMETGPMVGIDGSWLEQDVGTAYSPYDRGISLSIPDDEAVPVPWDCDDIQFPRLLAELSYLGLDDSTVLEAVADSMDLKIEDVVSLLDRARKAWESHIHPAGADDPDFTREEWTAEWNNNDTRLDYATWAANHRAMAAVENGETN